MGLVSASPEGTASLLFNVIIFTINLMGILLCLKPIIEKYKASTINDLKGLGRNTPILFIPLSVFLISSIGFPVTSGFIAKIYLYSAVISGGYRWLVFISIISTITYLYFIFRFIYSIFSAPRDKKTVKIETVYKIILLVFLIPVILFGVYFAPLFNLAKYSSKIFGI
jgi:NADH-quinone oxidoreductase subunit N